MEENQPKGALPLAAVVQQLRGEIEKAVKAATEGDEDLRFRLDKVQLEFEVGVTRSGRGGTKAQFWVLEFGVEGEVAKSQTQKVVLELTPQRMDPQEKEEEDSEILLGRAKAPKR